MKVLVYSIHGFDQPFLEKAAAGNHQLVFTEQTLNDSTASMASGYEAVALFTSDNASAQVIKILHSLGVKYIALRSVGFDHVDLKQAEQCGIKVANVPEYSPNAIAEHAVALILALNRKIISADKQVHQYNFNLNNLIGFDLNKKTVGIIGTGKIGSIAAKILHGFGCKILAYDIEQKEYLKKYFGVEYVDLEVLCQKSDIITIHCPLNEQTRYLINKENISLMKNGVIIINTARGAVINTVDVIEGLKARKIGSLGIDVYEKEKGLFFEDLSMNIPNDDIFNSLLTLKNVLITGHQAFLTNEALQGIAETTISNLDEWSRNKASKNDLF